MGGICAASFLVNCVGVRIGGEGKLLLFLELMVVLYDGCSNVHEIQGTEGQI